MAPALPTALWAMSALLELSVHCVGVAHFVPHGGASDSRIALRLTKPRACKGSTQRHRSTEKGTVAARPSAMKHLQQTRSSEKKNPALGRCFGGDIQVMGLLQGASSKMAAFSVKILGN